MTSRLGLNLARVMGTKVCPNEPVPPVISMDELVNTISLYWFEFKDFSFSAVAFAKLS